LNRKHFSVEQKAEIVLLGLRDSRTISEICREHGVAPVTFSRWKRAYLTGGLEALSKNKKSMHAELERENKRLKEAIGQLYVELLYLKKNEVRGK